MKINKRMINETALKRQMLNEYLQFASSRSLEKSENFNLTNLIIDIIKKYENKKITSDISENVLPAEEFENQVEKWNAKKIEDSLPYIYKNQIKPYIPAEDETFCISSIESIPAFILPVFS